jgi:hypothetical protein
MWTPGDNPKKESIAVVVGPRLLGGDARAFARTRKAQQKLRDGRITRDVAVTANGLAGQRFDVVFSPAGGDGRVYERSHVVLVAGDRLVHVLYTAAEPDPARAALAGVLATISIQEGG